jgi:hypothetical protein
MLCCSGVVDAAGSAYLGKNINLVEHHQLYTSSLTTIIIDHKVQSPNMATDLITPKSLPPVAAETFEHAATRLHALLDDYLAIARSQKEADQGLRPSQKPARKIDGNEFAIREDIAETCRRVAAMVVNPVDEMMVMSYQVSYVRSQEFPYFTCSIITGT